MELKIGAVIAAARRAKNMTQEALAGAVGVSAAAVSKWETNASYPDITLLPPLARALGLTVDALLDFRDQPTDEELHAIVARLGKVFDAQGYTAGRAACEDALREYPTSGSLKIAVGGLYYRYVGLALDGKADPGDMLADMNARACALFEQGEQQTDNPNEALATRVLRASMHIMTGTYDEAEALLDSIPKPLANPDQLYHTLYLARGELDRAEKLSRRMLLCHVNEALVALMNLCTVARRREDWENARLLTDTYEALTRLLRLNPYNSLQMQLLLAQQEQDHARTLDVFEQLADALLHYSLDYTDNPFFTGVQEVVPSAAQTAATQRLALRAIEEDGDLDPLRGEPRFETALDRLRRAIPAE